MFVTELECVPTTAPRRWIAWLSSSKDGNDTAHLLKRTIEKSNCIDVGWLPCCQWVGAQSHRSESRGREMLLPRGNTERYLGVWDLVCILDGDMSSDGKQTKARRHGATRVNYIEEIIFQPTPDGLGIRIFPVSYLVYDILHCLILWTVKLQANTSESVAKLTT